MEIQDMRFCSPPVSKISEQVTTLRLVGHVSHSFSHSAGIVPQGGTCQNSEQSELVKTEFFISRKLFHLFRVNGFSQLVYWKGFETVSFGTFACALQTRSLV